jgi:hypothetical protein
MGSGAFNLVWTTTISCSLNCSYTVVPHQKKFFSFLVYKNLIYFFAYFDRFIRKHYVFYKKLGLSSSRYLLFLLSRVPKTIKVSKKIIYEFNPCQLEFCFSIFYNVLSSFIFSLLNCKVLHHGLLFWELWRFYSFEE